VTGVVGGSGDDTGGVSSGTTADKTLKSTMQQQNNHLTSIYQELLGEPVPKKHSFTQPVFVAIIQL